MKQQITITPAMRLIAWAQETHSAKVAVSVNFYGNHVHLYVYDTTGEQPESVIELHCHEWFSHEKCNEWIFAANQAIEQYTAAQEAALRMVA